MSAQDRQIWNRRYRDGAYAERRHPSSFLVEQIHGSRQGRALDLACGAGRNAIYLATCGYRVDALDISTVGLEQARRAAARVGVEVNWQVQDLLLDGSLPRDDYDLIILFRFVAPQLLARLPEHLAPGGLVIVEEHLQTTAEVTGPGNPRYRVAPGALAQGLASLAVIDEFEGLVSDPDGSAAALARIAARN